MSPAAVQPRTETLAASDTFTDAIGVFLTAHTPDLGAGWTDDGGTWSITGTNSIAVNPSSRSVAVNGTTLTDDQAAELQLISGALSGVGPIVRWTGDGNGTGYSLIGASDGIVHLIRWDGGGAAVNLGSGGTSVNGQVLKLMAVGPLLTALQDGIQLFAVTDDLYGTGRAGMMAWTGGSSVPQAEAFKAFNLEAGGNGDEDLPTGHSGVDAVCARLLEIPAVTAIVGTRVYALILPQDEELPAIRVQSIDRDDPMHLRGTVGWITQRIQVDHYAVRTDGGDALLTARQLAAAAHGQFIDGAASGLAGWRGTIGDPPIRVDQIRLADEREEFTAAELNEVRIMQDYIVNWRER